MHLGTPRSHVQMLLLNLLLLHLFFKTICVHNDLGVEFVKVLNVLLLQVFQLIDFIFVFSSHLALNVRPEVF